MAQLFFIAFVALVTALLWRSRDSAHGRAWKRLFLVGFASLVVITILLPEGTTRVANLIGIGRGSDLVFYLTSFGVMLLAALTYLKFRSMEERIAVLTRHLALSEWERDRAAKNGQFE